LAVGGDVDGAAVILSSSSGMDWTPRNAGTQGALSAITYGNGLFVALADAGTILTSADSVNWAERQSGTDLYLASVTYGNNRFVAVGGSFLGRRLRSSSSADGVNWSETNSGTQVSLHGLVYGNGQFVAIGEACADNVCEGTVVAPLTA
jgi:hypothetical protein